MCPETCDLCAPTGPPVQEAGNAITGGRRETPTPTVLGLCKDKADNCNELIDFCTDTNAIGRATFMCAKTCGFCEGNI